MRITPFFGGDACFLSFTKALTATHENIGTNEWLTKAERSSLAHVLHNACLVNGTKVSVLYAIELMSEGYKRILMHESEEELPKAF